MTSAINFKQSLKNTTHAQTVTLNTKALKKSSNKKYVYKKCSSDKNKQATKSIKH